jgi:hypothetical protein
MTRIVGVSLAYLAATLVLVGLCGVPGLLVWLGCMALGLCMPMRLVNAVTSLRWRHVAAAWSWLDRR